MTTPSIDPMKVKADLALFIGYLQYTYPNGKSRNAADANALAILPTLLALQAAVSAPVARGYWCERDSEYMRFQPQVGWNRCNGCHLSLCNQPVIIIATEGK